MRTRIAVCWVGVVSMVWGQALPPLYRIDTVAGTMPNEEGVAVAQTYLTRPNCALTRRSVSAAAGVLTM